jgi:hypothetical protein
MWILCHPNFLEYPSTVKPLLAQESIHRPPLAVIYQRIVVLQPGIFRLSYLAPPSPFNNPPLHLFHKLLNIQALPKATLAPRNMHINSPCTLIYYAHNCNLMAALFLVTLVNADSIRPEENTVRFMPHSLQSQEKIGRDGKRLTVASDEPFVFWTSPNIGDRIVVRGLFQFEHFESDNNGGLSIARMEPNETNKLTGRSRLEYMHFEMEKI